MSGSPFPVAQPSLDRALNAWRFGDVSPYVERIKFERAELFQLLERLGALPWQSQANFVFARFKDAAGVAARLRDQKIVAREFSSSPNIADCLRITCPGDERLFERLCTALGGQS
jgi:histidinol-phosphate aminotransferase